MLGRGAGVEIPHWNTLDNKEVKAGLRFVLTLREFRNAWKGGQGLRFLITLHEILGRGGRGLKFVFTLQGSILRYLGEQIKWDNFINWIVIPPSSLLYVFAWHKQSFCLFCLHQLTCFKDSQHRLTEITYTVQRKQNCFKLSGNLWCCEPQQPGV